MAEKRKDNKGRNLFTGESQRKDGSYMYRCTDDYGKRHTVYAPTLKELREKEKELQKDIADGLSITNGNITVSELLQIYFDSNKKWKISTITQKRYAINIINQYPIAKMRINQVRTSHIKGFYLTLFNIGIHKGGIAGYHNVLRPAFEIAKQDDWIKKNPCNIRLDFLPPSTKRKEILSKEQEEDFLNFVKETEKLKWYYDIFVLMLETGLRIGETVGLTLNDIDLKNRKLTVDHQLRVTLCCDSGKSLRVDTLKTENGKRDIYISDRAYESILRLIERRNKETPVEIIIDGYSKFLLKSSKQSKIVTHKMIEYHLAKSVKMYNESHKKKIPHITPHSLRHTFCTRMIENGIDIKSLQYIMGHTDVKMTLDIYTHMSGEVAMCGMKNAVSNSI